MDNLTPDYRFSSSNQPSSISVIWQNPVQSINSSPNSIERSYQDEGSLNHSSYRLRQSFYELSTTWSRHLISTIHFDHDIRTSGQRICRRSESANMRSAIWLPLWWIIGWHELSRDNNPSLPCVVFVSLISFWIPRPENLWSRYQNADSTFPSNDKKCLRRQQWMNCCVHGIHHNTVFAVWWSK
jgi:hypothetical protein